VNGVDVDPACRDPGDYAPRCRVFHTPQGLRGIWDRGWIEAALLARPNRGRRSGQLRLHPDIAEVTAVHCGADALGELANTGAVEAGRQGHRGPEQLRRIQPHVTRGHHREADPGLGPVQKGQDGGRQVPMAPDPEPRRWEAGLQET
jgi:hypothetical protein